MKILLATSFFPPTHTAGTEKRTFGYAKTLIERGHSVQVLCAGKWDEGDRYWNGHTDEVFQGVPVRRIHLNWNKSPDPNNYLYNNPQTAQFFTQCLSQWQPDLIHITSCITLSASIIAVAREHEVPLVLTLTDFWFVCHKLSLLKYDGSLCNGVTTSYDCIQCLSWDSGAYQKLKNVSSAGIATQVFDRLSKIPVVTRQSGLRGTALDIDRRKSFVLSMLDAANVVTAPSNHLRETLSKSGITREIKVIQSGHDLSWLGEFEQKGPSDRIRFGYIGQFIPTKGVHTLLDAFCRYNWQGRAELHLFGNHEANPAYTQQLRQIENHNQDVIFFHGAFLHERLGEILANLDVVVVPSVWHENNPRIIQEAFAGKTMVIASDVGGVAEYVKHEVNGLLFRRGDSDDLSLQIQRIIDEPALRAQIIAHLPKVRSIHDELDEIENVYHQLLS
jgi:glycosyltransferase involved in cell wall biosynthesis